MKKLTQAAAVGAIAFVIVACLTLHGSGGRGHPRVFNGELALVGAVAASVLTFTRKKKEER